MSFNFSIREAKAFHRSLEAQVTVVGGAGVSLSTGAGVSQGYDYRRFDPNNPPPTPEVPLPYEYRRADSYRSPGLDDLVRTVNGGVPSPVAPWAEWEGSITDEAVDEAAVARAVSVLQGPISAWAERVAHRQTAADNGYATPTVALEDANRAEAFRRRVEEHARRRGRLHTATRSEAEAMAAQMGMVAIDIETDPRMAPDRVYRPPTAPPQVFLDPQAVEQMRHETMRTMEELRASQRAYIRSPEEVTLSTLPNIAGMGLVSTPTTMADPYATSEAGIAAAELIREAMNRPGVMSMAMEGRGLPPTRTINAGVIIDPSDIP